jgi:hypothetical protein
VVRQTFQLVRCGCTFRVTSQTPISPTRTERSYNYGIGSQWGMEIGFPNLKELLNWYIHPSSREHSLPKLFLSLRLFVEIWSQLNRYKLSANLPYCMCMEMYSTICTVHFLVVLDAQIICLGNQWWNANYTVLCKVQFKLRTK